MEEISALMLLLTGVEETLVVNNNAAALWLTLAALVPAREIVIARGEAVEIGGGVRIPEIVSAAGTRLVEVGTTNRTRSADYERAIGPETSGFLKIHQSNFAMVGFVESVDTRGLSAIASAHRLLLIEDVGTGSLIDTRAHGLAGEPTIGETWKAGASVITASGDKLLGGPQAGMVCGRADLIASIATHPLARTVRADKTVLAGVAETLRHYLRGDELTEIPIWRAIVRPLDQLTSRAEILIGRLRAAGVKVELALSDAFVGGGSLPGQRLPSAALAFSGRDSDGLARRLRTGDPGVFGRIQDGRVLLDLRAIEPADDPLLLQAVVTATRSTNESRTHTEGEKVLSDH